MTTPEQAALTLILPLAPSTNGLYANRRGGRRKTDHYTTWLQEANAAAAQQITQRFAGPVDVSIAVPIIMSGDIDNRCKATLDWLVHREIIADDRVIRQLLVKRSLPSDDRDWMVVTVATTTARTRWLSAAQMGDSARGGGMAIQDDHLIVEASGRLRIKHGKDVLDVPEEQAWQLLAHELCRMLAAERRKARGP